MSGKYLRPIDLLEEAAPVFALLHPDFPLGAKTKFLAACSSPQIVDSLQVSLTDGFDLCTTTSAGCSEQPVLTELRRDCCI